MSQHLLHRRFRPYLFTSFRRLQCQQSTSRRAFTCSAQYSERELTNDYKKRVNQLEAYKPAGELYPRLRTGSEGRWPIQRYREELDFLEKDETMDDGDTFTVMGRVQSVRNAGSKLVFLDLQQDDSSLQAVCAFGKLEDTSEEYLGDFKRFGKIARKGDWFEVTGYPHRTASGELSIRATTIPTLLSPSLHQIPERLYDDETRARGRHVEMMMPDNQAIQTLRVRHMVEQHLNNSLIDDSFIKVSTPILNAGAGGAIARPFETEATELEGQKLNLRIAPELWLKRLVIGGMEKVYEIGPAFRNEGVDATHNPEFYTCEFYEAFATLDDLMNKTERLLQSMAELITVNRHTTLEDLHRTPSPFAPPPWEINFTSPFQRLPFIPTLEAQLNETLPDLSSSSAETDLIGLCNRTSTPLPANPTLPRLLDALASGYLEPLCKEPTFITHHPACLSPLSKTFTCPITNQRVAARAELFIAGTEYANMYEEENNPFQQRANFEAQVPYRKVDGEGDKREGIDEQFLEALEWGLPPTGGWGCGIERLVMLMSGRARIGDVLPFGTLRNVVGLGKRRG